MPILSTLQTPIALVSARAPRHAATAMGGNLFHLPRMPRDEYILREREVCAYLDRRMPGQYRIPRYYATKPDFGDLDVLVVARPDWDVVRADIVHDLGITQVKAVGHVYSTVYRGLQTDFFTVPDRYLDTMRDFMSFNDLGNLIGRICRRFDLKYGEHGLSYVYRHETGHFQRELEVSADFARVCAFLGLDHGHWSAGFDTLPEVFDWLIESPWFSVAPYLDDTPNSLSRRAGVRPTIARFLDHLRAHNIGKRIDFLDRREYLPRVIAAFPEANLATRIEEQRTAAIRALEVAARFSGKRIMRLIPGLEGKPLGEFILKFKASFPNFEAWVLAATEAEIDGAIVERACVLGHASVDGTTE